MIISDLTYLEVASEASSIEGGLLNYNGFGQVNNAPIHQFAYANAGGGGINILPVAAAVNAALPIQVNA